LCNTSNLDQTLAIASCLGTISPIESRIETGFSNKRAPFLTDFRLRLDGFVAMM
jgi:hypothetical protein